ncbi:MAG: TRAP transporter substrate-binding protein [Rhodobacteraceae bacterium]|nr:TRAP transporter substrate-binding protein [Paracoccaceae bacterium]
MLRIPAGAAALASALVLAATASAQEYKFKLHHFLSELTPSHTEIIAPWVERVEANSGGRVDIEIYPSMSLGGKPPELVSQARDGVVDLVWTLNGYTPGLFPRTEVFELPTVYRNDPSAANLAMRAMFDADLAEDYAGLKVMFLQVHTGNGLHMVDREVRAPADLAGLNLRTPSRTGAWVIEALGANPVAMPVPDLPQALSRKVVDGALLPWDIVPPLKLQEQTGFQVDGDGQVRLGTSTFQLSMNLERWNGLPPDIQQAFLDASDAAWAEELGHIWRRADDAGIAISEEAGVDYYRLTPEETAAFEAAVAPVVDRWVADMESQGIDGAGLVERARAAIAENAAGGS